MESIEKTLGYDREMLVVLGIFSFFYESNNLQLI